MPAPSTQIELKTELFQIEEAHTGSTSSGNVDSPPEIKTPSNLLSLETELKRPSNEINNLQVTLETISDKVKEIPETKEENLDKID